MKKKLEETTITYKKRADQKRKEVNFNVGGLVLAHLRKERFPKGEYNKLKAKKIGPCKILRKFSNNAYEIELPPGIGISPIFNVANLYLFKGEEETIEVPEKEEEHIVEWEKQLPKETPKQPEDILDKKVVKKTRGKEYFQYLIKWKGCPLEDATWMIASELSKYGVSIEDLMDRSP